MLNYEILESYNLQQLSWLVSERIADGKWEVLGRPFHYVDVTSYDIVSAYGENRFTKQAFCQAVILVKEKEPC
jgi:hypothetical protein